MSESQRFVSDELTHFVGRGQTESKQFELFQQILRGGVPLSPQYASSAGQPIVVTYSDHVFQDNDFTHQNAVCFCDIPVADLSLHMKKYSVFGLSFRRDFLVAQGINPVWYISKSSTDSMFPNRLRGDVMGIWNASFKALPDIVPLLFENELFKDVNGHLIVNHHNSVHSWIPESLEEPLLRYYNSLRDFFSISLFHVVPHMKFFDATLADDDPDNFYMEREWRVHGEVRFQTRDIERLIFPRNYAGKMREEFPEYIGQITFSD